MADKQPAAAGVQELINRIRDEGVAAARQETDRILQEARQQAAQIVDQAKAESKELREKARAEIEAERKAAQEALRIAARDTILAFQSRLRAAFALHVQRLVSSEMRDTGFLRQLILAIVDHAVPKVEEGKKIEVQISEALFEADGGKPTLAGPAKERCRQFILGVSGEMLRAGVQLTSYAAQDVSMRVRLVGEDLEVDISDKALSDLLLSHLIPRYRAIFLGVE